MSQNELLVDGLHRNLGMLNMTLADMTDAELLQRPVPGANNGLWQLGHLIAAEAGMINGCAGKTINELPAGFAERFNSKTALVDDPAKLGAKADLLGLLGQVRERTCHLPRRFRPLIWPSPRPSACARCVRPSGTR